MQWTPWERKDELTIYLYFELTTDLLGQVQVRGVRDCYIVTLYERKQGTL